MSIVEAQDPIQVTATFRARSRLDKRGGAAKGGQHAAGSCPSCRGWPFNELRHLGPQPGAHGMSVAFSRIHRSRVLRARAWFKRAVVWVTLCVLVRVAILARSASEGSGYTRLRFGLVCRRCYPLKNGARPPISSAAAGSMQPDATDVRRGRLVGCDLEPSAAGTPKWRSRPPKKRHFAPFFSSFLMVFSGFFCGLAQEGANWRPCGPEKRWF